MCFPGRKCYRFLFLPQQVHRTLMTTTVLFTIAGIIVIFVHKKGWSSVSRVMNCESNCNIDVINPYRQTSLVKAGVQKNISLFVLSSILKITHVIVLKGKIGLHCNHERIRYVNHLFLAPQQAHKANTISNQVRLDMSAISFIYLSIFLKIYFMLDFFLFIFLCFNRQLAHIHTLVSSSSLSQLRSQSWQHSDHILASLGTCVHLQLLHKQSESKEIHSEKL